MKGIAVAICVIAGFWAGYGLSSYRAYAVTLPELSRAQEISNAGILIRSVDLIDRGDIAPLRAKLVAVAKVSTDNPTRPSGFSWKGFLFGPLEDTADSVERMRQSTDEQLSSIRADIARICLTAPATDAYRHVCGR